MMQIATICWATVCVHFLSINYPVSDTGTGIVQNIFLFLYAKNKNLTKLKFFPSLLHYRYSNLELK
jgi:hypothetical protein